MNMHGSCVLIHVAATACDFILTLFPIFILDLASHHSEFKILVDALVLVLEILVLVRTASLCFEGLDRGHVLLGEIVLESFHWFFIVMMSIHILYRKLVRTEVWMKPRSSSKVCSALGSNENSTTTITLLDRRDMIGVSWANGSISHNLWTV